MASRSNSITGAWRSAQANRRARVALAATVMAALAGPAQAADLTFDAARERLIEVSDALSGAEANVQSRDFQRRATASLDYPQVDLDVRQVRFHKTLEVGLSSLQQRVGVPPGLLPDTLDLSTQGNRLRPALSFNWPLYTGGQISATQRAAAAAVDQASAERDIVRDTLDLQLVQAYFGQQLALRVARIRAAVRSGLQQHRDNALAMQREGMISRAQQLQSQVALDEATRESLRADNDLLSAQTALANLLHQPGSVQPSTPLAVLTSALPPLPVFIKYAQDAHPQLARGAALESQGAQGVDIERARRLPQVYLFGIYDLYRRDAFLTDLDWVVGVGLRYTLWSNVDRGSSIASAQSRQAQAAAGVRQLRIDLETAVTRAYLEVDTAREQFLLLDSTLEQTRENQRLQELSFREGLATSLDVIDARLAAGRALTQRAQAAYQFTLALAQLLNASGRTAELSQYLKRADKVVSDE